MPIVMAAFWMIVFAFLIVELGGWTTFLLVTIPAVLGITGCIWLGLKLNKWAKEEREERIAKEEAEQENQALIDGLERENASLRRQVAQTREVEVEAR